MFGISIVWRPHSAQVIGVGEYAVAAGFEWPAEQLRGTAGVSSRPSGGAGDDVVVALDGCRVDVELLAPAWECGTASWVWFFFEFIWGEIRVIKKWKCGYRFVRGNVRLIRNELGGFVH